MGKNGGMGKKFILTSYTTQTISRKVRRYEMCPFFPWITQDLWNQYVARGAHISFSLFVCWSFFSHTQRQDKPELTYSGGYWENLPREPTEGNIICR